MNKAVNNIMKLFPPFFKKYQPYKVWWPLIVIIVLFLGTNIWVYPTLKRLEENALHIQLDSALIARRSIENFNSFHLFTSLWNTGSFLGLMPESKDAIISKLFREQWHFTQAEIINSRGEVVDYFQNKEKKAERARPAEGSSYSQSELFKKVSQGGTYSGATFIEGSVPYLIVAVPIFSSGSFSGGLILKSDLSFLQSLATLKIRAEEEIYVINSDGNPILHSGYPEQLPQIQIKERKVVAEISGGELESVTGAYINEKGKRVQATAVFYKYLGWGVIVEEPVSIIFAARNYMLFLALLMATGQLFLMGLLIKNIFSLIRTTEDLKRSKAELEEAKSVLEVKVKARTKELSELAQNLEKTVGERTKDLRQRVKELERFHRLTIGRELKMAELKKEITKLKVEEPGNLKNS